MKYLKEFNTHASYEDKINIGGSDLEIPIVSYCDDVSDVHYNPYNTVEFYVGEITGITQPTVSIYTDESNSIDITVSEVNKWYSYLLPKNKGLFRIIGSTVKKVVVKANITTNETLIIPSSTVEASFKGSNTSNVTNMRGMFATCHSLTSLDVSRFNTSNVTNMSSMFQNCNHLTSLDLSGFDTSKVTGMDYMFEDCTALQEIKMIGCSTDTVNKIKQQLESCHITGVTITT